MTKSLNAIAQKLMEPGKGILAADESEGTIAKRFAKINLPNSLDLRRDYREMLFRSTEAMKNYISGVILTEETLEQSATDGTPFRAILADADVIPGIKVDRGAFSMPGDSGEKITEGLDGLRQRLERYASLGAGFAKWRAVITINDVAPTRNNIRANAHALARYAILCQEAGIVPVVEPEVVGDGDPGNHSMERCAAVTGDVLENTFKELRLAGVDLSVMLLKPNMVLPGVNSRERPSFEDVAKRTVEVLREHVPAAVPGIAFLSGGQTDEEATAHLSAMNQIGGKPWPLTFSYGRALQNVALRTWGWAAGKLSGGSGGLYAPRAHEFACSLGQMDGRTGPRSLALNSLGMIWRASRKGSALFLCAARVGAAKACSVLFVAKMGRHNSPRVAIAPKVHGTSNLSDHTTQ